MAAKVTASDRKKSGMRGGKYPARTHAQRMSALRLRGNGKGVSASAVVAHVATWARKTHDTAALNKIEQIRSQKKRK